MLNKTFINVCLILTVRDKLINYIGDISPSHSRQEGGSMAKREKVTNEKINREEGYLYYIGKDGYVWAAPMKHNKGGRKKKVGAEKITKEAGYMYFVGTDGYVYKVKMKNA